MTERAELHVEPTGERILAFMRQQPDGVSDVHEIVNHLGEAEPKIRAALAKLERLGFVDRGHDSSGVEEYIINPAAPEPGQTAG